MASSEVTALLEQLKAAGIDRPWDPALADAMQAAGTAVEEELLMDCQLGISPDR